MAGEEEKETVLPLESRLSNILDNMKNSTIQ